MKVERTYMKPGYSIPKDPCKPLGETVPCLLFITSEVIDRNIKYTIKGRYNPLPFNVCTIPVSGLKISVEKWIEDNGWIEIGRNYS